VTTLELDTQRRLTRAFIATMPVSVALVPRTRTKTSAGGYVFVNQPPRVPQTLRLIESSAIPRPVVTLDGIVREADFELLGAHDAEMGVYDVFSIDGRQWEVVSLAHDNGWERRALVTRVG
jgi:hypothetical protein